MTNIRQLSEDLQKQAIKQLNEIPERIPDDLDALKTWIKQQPHLRARIDDQFLLAFLRGCKYSLERAKSKLDKYYTLRTKYPEYFRITNVDDQRVREILRLGVFLWLPRPLHDNGPRIYIVRSGVYSPDKYNMTEIIRVMQCTQDILLLEDDYFSVMGGIGIIDLDKVTAGHMFQMTPSFMKKITTYSEEAVPVRPKASHFISTPKGFDHFFNIFKPMLSAKQQKRLYVHGDKIDSLHEHIPKKYLPLEYGGENGSIQDIIDYWEAKFDEYRDYFKDEINYGTDEELRPGQPIDFDELFGMEGSFRKLNVD